MRNATASGNSMPTEPQAYSPSVPISIYRQMAAELEATKAQMESVNAHNQHLQQENQQLRLEIDKVVQSTYRLQQVVSSFQPYTPTAAPRTAGHSTFGMQPPYPSQSSHGVHAAGNESVMNNPFPVFDPDANNSAFAQPLYTEQQEVRPRRGPKPRRSSDMGGVWLAVTIFLIVVAAFGAGYWIVRPMLLKR